MIDARYTQLTAWHATRAGRFAEEESERLLRLWMPAVFGRNALIVKTFEQGLDWFEDARVRRRFAVGGGVADVRGDPEALPVDAECLDLVVARHALEYAHDPCGLLREFDRVLLADGWLALTWFNPLGPQGWQKWFRMDAGAPWNGHFYSPHRVSLWLSALGFEIVDSRCAGSPLARLRRAPPSAARAWCGTLCATLARKRVSRLRPLELRERRRLLAAGVMRPTA